jgi:hypothetical protein
MISARQSDVLAGLLEARTTAQIETILSRLPVVDPGDYQWDHSNKRLGKWRPNHLHWLPVGLDRGNGGRIKLAGEPFNPIAERLVNGMEAIIELERQRELHRDSSAAMPLSPREAVLRYFALPRLDSIPHMDVDEVKGMVKRINEARRKLTVRLAFDKKSRQFAIVIRDLGMGQTHARIHETLLSLGQSDKADKPYLIGVFGQGGSSAFAASECSVIVSRRSPDILGAGESGALGWSIVRQIFPKGRRDPYFAYLAATEQGMVPSVEASAAEKTGFTNGSHFCHIKYDFGGSESSVARLLYQALNHVLFNPILPYDLFTIAKDKPELMQGTAQRLARKARLSGRQLALDKSFGLQSIA